MHIVSLNWRKFLLISFYLSKFFCVMPIKFVKFLDNSFRVSLMGACTSVAVLAVDSLYIYDKFCRLRSCKLNLECPPSYIGLIDACYCFSLIFFLVFFSTHQLCYLMNEVFLLLNIGKNNQTVLLYNQPLILYIFLIIEFLRIILFKLPEFSFSEILFWLLTIFAKNVAFAMDGLITLVFFIAKTNTYNINCQFQDMCNTDNVKNQLQHILIAYSQCFDLLKKLSDCFGPIIVVTALYKLLQIFGIVYFTLLSDNSTINGNDVNLESDVIVPTFCLIFIFSTATSLYNEVQFSNIILGSLFSKKDEFNICPEVEMFLCIMHYRKHCPNASNFFVIHLTVFLKVCSLTLIYILTLLQILQKNASQAE